MIASVLDSSWFLRDLLLLGCFETHGCYKYFDKHTLITSSNDIVVF